MGNLSQSDVLSGINRMGPAKIPEHEEAALGTQHNEALARKQDKDQRSELRRLQQIMLTSAQQTFDPDVWEGCGIEAERQTSAACSAACVRPLPEFECEER